MRYLLILFFFLTPFAADASIPVLVEPTVQNEAIQIDEPDVLQAMYGTLRDSPNTFEINPTEPLELFVEILVPDIASAKNNVSGIIVRQLKEGGVEEVARLRAKDAGWEEFFESSTGDSYRRGPKFHETVPAGSYLIEVSTPDNLEPYVLAVGTKERPSDIGYLETIARIARVKAFFGKSQFAVIESPYAY